MLNNFIEVLEDPDLDREPNYRRLLAYETNFPDENFRKYILENIAIEGEAQISYWGI